MRDFEKREEIAEKAVRELVQAGSLKKLSDVMANQIAVFYENKCLNRLQTAKLVYEASRDLEKRKGLGSGYADYSEVVAAAYYAMYYVVHAYLALAYKTKLRERVRGVHAITHNLVLYYLVKTKMLAKHLYEEYLETLETTFSIQRTVESFQPEAHKYAEKYDEARDAREIFTYNTTPNIEAHHAEKAVKTAEEFINTVRQLMQQVK